VPAQALLLDGALSIRLEILPVEAQGAIRRGDELGAREQHSAGKLALFGGHGVGQAAAHADDFALVVDAVVLAVADTALVGIAEQEVRVILAVTRMPDDLYFFAGEDGVDDLRAGDAGLDLDLEALLLLKPADGYQLAEDIALARDQEGVDAAGVVRRDLAQCRLVDGEQGAIAHQPAPIDHDIGDVGALGGVDDLGVNGIGIALELGNVV